MTSARFILPVSLICIELYKVYLLLTCFVRCILANMHDLVKLKRQKHASLNLCSRKSPNHALVYTCFRLMRTQNIEAPRPTRSKEAFIDENCYFVLKTCRICKHILPLSRICDIMSLKNEEYYHENEIQGHIYMWPWLYVPYIFDR